MPENATARESEFEKVPYDEFAKAAKKYVYTNSGDYEDIIREDYNNIKLPAQATSGSCGHDFKYPFKIMPKPSYSDKTGRCKIIIPTGIRVFLQQTLAMFIFPRSSYGFKYDIELANSVGIIDSDYYHAENYGHIMIALSITTASEADIKAAMIVAENMWNRSSILPVNIAKDEAFAQGVIMPFVIASGAGTFNKRIGGIGSTTV